MKRLVQSLGIIIAALGVVFYACSESPVTPTNEAVSLQPAAKLFGPEGPYGTHYNLNLIGVKDKSAAMDDNNGHRIFVPLDRKTKILLQQGPDFAVLDANATDGNGGKFQLPNPDPDCDGTTEYSVYIRALGKPHGKAKMQSCYTIEVLLEDGKVETQTYCAAYFEGGVQQISVERDKGKPQWSNVTESLLYVDVCVEWQVDELGAPVFDADGNPVCATVNRVPLFGEDNIDYLWEYDNTNLKLAQLRFYPIPETGFDPDCTDTPVPAPAPVPEP